MVWQKLSLNNGDQSYKQYMKAKLIKVGDHYDLYYRDEVEDLIIGFASTDSTFERKLSLKNCQEIEQQFPTERMWDVEVDEEKEFIFDPAMGITQGFYLDKPKLDVDGCLILKMYETT